jgi:hypothetical protein
LEEESVEEVHPYFPFPSEASIQQAFLEAFLEEARLQVEAS